MDRGQAVGITVPVRGHNHDPSGESQQAAASREPVKDDQTGVAEPFSNPSFSIGTGEVDVVRGQHAGSHRGG